MRILAAEQTLDNTTWFQGTADAVRRNMLHLETVGYLGSYGRLSSAHKTDECNISHGVALS